MSKRLYFWNQSKSGRKNRLIFDSGDDVEYNMRVFFHKPKVNPVVSYVNNPYTHYLDLMSDSEECIKMMYDNMPNQIIGEDGRVITFRRATRVCRVSEGTHILSIDVKNDTSDVLSCFFSVLNRLQIPFDWIDQKKVVDFYN